MQRAMTNCRSFNTQPPEGGWVADKSGALAYYSFNTQPPEGGWKLIFNIEHSAFVSTHSRLKAAGFWMVAQARLLQFQHTAA